MSTANALVFGHIRSANLLAFNLESGSEQHYVMIVAKTTKSRKNSNIIIIVGTNTYLGNY